MSKRVFILMLIAYVELGCFNTMVKSEKNYLKRDQIYERYAANYFYEDADNLEERYSDEYEEELAESESNLKNEGYSKEGDLIYLPNVSRNRTSVYSPIIRFPYGGMGLEFGNNFGVGGYGRGNMFGSYYGGIGPNNYYSMGYNDWYWRQRPYDSYYDYWRHGNYGGYWDALYNDRLYRDREYGGFVPSNASQNGVVETNDDVNIRGRRFYKSNRNELEGTIEKQQSIAQPQGGVVIPSWQNTNSNVTPAPIYSPPVQNYGNTPSNSSGSDNNASGGRGSIQAPNSRRSIGRER